MSKLTVDSVEVISSGETYEKGFVPMLEAAADAREHQGFIALGFAAKKLLTTIQFLSSLYDYVPGYKKRESGNLLVPSLSQNPFYTTSHIRCLVWHPHCTKVAVAGSDDTVRIYSDTSELVPILKCRSQQLIACLAWRPLCASEVAVGCAVGVVLWHVDPSSVITRPSAAHTQVLTRPGHTHVTALAWSPQGDLLVTGSATDDTMYVWETGLDIAVPLKRVGGGGISCLTWSPDSLKLFASTTNLVFRVWQTYNWEPDRWTVMSGRVVSAAWSPCSTIVLFAVSQEPIIYALGCGLEASVFQAQERRAATPLIDVTPVELGSFERVGGDVANLAWDKTGHCLAISFRGCDAIAVFMSSFSQTVHVSPCCLIKGEGTELPATIGFQENFKHGANLTIGWTSGRVQYFPILFSDFDVNKTNLHNASHLQNLSSFTLP